jgi:hypothetical protein
MLRHTKLHEASRCRGDDAATLPPNPVQGVFPSDEVADPNTASQLATPSDQSLAHPAKATASHVANDQAFAQAAKAAHRGPEYSTSSHTYGMNIDKQQPQIDTSVNGGFDYPDFGFDWGVASEDIFTLLRSDHQTLNLALPISSYAQATPEAQTSLSTGSIDQNLPTSSVDVSRDAVVALSQVIKELPGKLVAELENTDVASSFFDECMDYFFTIFLPTFPIIHRPTFHARDCGSPLLLNMLALGSSFIGSKEARARVSTPPFYITKTPFN